MNNDSERGTHTLPDKSAGTKEKPAFVNWFDVGVSKESTDQKTKCTFTDKYGKTSELDVDMLNH